MLCKALSGQPINLSGHPVHIMPKNVFLVGLGLGFDVLIYIHHYRRGTNFSLSKSSSKVVLREIICGKR
jgi:hypothetical protein